MSSLAVVFNQFPKFLRTRFSDTSAIGCLLTRTDSPAMVIYQFSTCEASESRVICWLAGICKVLYSLLMAVMVIGGIGPRRILFKSWGTLYAMLQDPNSVLKVGRDIECANGHHVLSVLRAAAICGIPARLDPPIRLSPISETAKTSKAANPKAWLYSKKVFP